MVHQSLVRERFPGTVDGEWPMASDEAHRRASGELLSAPLTAHIGGEFEPQMRPGCRINA